jgi:HSP20 family molecular chaperone IbpA
MSDKTGFDKCWEGVDRALLFVVFVLLALSFWESYRSESKETLSDGGGFRWREPAALKPSAPALAVRAPAAYPVSLSRSRVSSIARTMAKNGWEGLPSSPAADMREENGTYDIFFTLPQRTDPSSVKVSTSGNVLTLFVNSAGVPAATFVKQFYIPCGAERAGAVETSVSNDIVRVRIRQLGG